MKRRRKRLRLIALVAAGVAILAAADWVVGARQSGILASRAELKKKLERMAMYSLRSDVQDVRYAGSKYEVRLRYENPFPDDEIFMMVPSVRVLVQVGTSWKEVPVAAAPAAAADRVLKVDRPLLFERTVQVPFRDYEEVLPGYMHVRINSVSYVSSAALSKEDVAEKSEDYYVYLKPWFADDREVSRKYAFSGDQVPVWIPMPPH